MVLICDYPDHDKPKKKESVLPKRHRASYLPGDLTIVGSPHYHMVFHLPEKDTEVILASDFDEWLQGIKDKMLKERARFESQGRAEFKGAFYSMTKDVMLFYDRLIDRLEAKWNG